MLLLLPLPFCEELRLLVEEAIEECRSLLQLESFGTIEEVEVVAEVTEAFL